MTDDNTIASLARLLASTPPPLTVVLIGSSGSGKTTACAQLLARLIDTNLIPPRCIAAHTVNRGSLAALSSGLIEHLWGPGSDESVADLAATISTVRHALFAGSADRAIDRGEKRDVHWSRRAFVASYMELIRIAAGLDPGTETRFIRQARRQIYAALRLDADARLGAELSSLYTHPALPAPSFVAEVAERYAAFKTERRLFDETDLRLAGVEPNRNIRLCLIDDAEDLAITDYALLRRLYPAASFLLVGNPAAQIRRDGLPLREVEHDHGLVILGRRRPIPSLWTIDARVPQARLVPSTLADSGDVLVVLGGRDQYALRRWIGWAMAGGLAYRIEDEDKIAPHIRDIAALWKCESDEVHPARLNRLAKAVGELPGRHIRAADFPGWTTWHEMAARAYSPAQIEYVERMLERYGSLELAGARPSVRITTVSRCKGRSAPVVIVDGFTMHRLDLLRWQIATSRASSRLTVLQHETNQKLRLPAALAD